MDTEKYEEFTKLISDNFVTFSQYSPVFHNSISLYNEFLLIMTGESIVIVDLSQKDIFSLTEKSFQGAYILTIADIYNKKALLNIKNIMNKSSLNYFSYKKKLSATTRPIFISASFSNTKETEDKAYFAVILSNYSIYVYEYDYRNKKSSIDDKWTLYSNISDELYNSFFMNNRKNNPKESFNYIPNLTMTWTDSGSTNYPSFLSLGGKTTYIFIIDIFAKGEKLICSLKLNKQNEDDWVSTIKWVLNKEESKEGVLSNYLSIGYTNGNVHIYKITIKREKNIYVFDSSFLYSLNSKSSLDGVTNIIWKNNEVNKYKFIVIRNRSIELVNIPKNVDVCKMENTGKMCRNAHKRLIVGAMLNEKDDELITTSIDKDILKWSTKDLSLKESDFAMNLYSHMDYGMKLENFTRAEFTPIHGISKCTCSMVYAVLFTNLKKEKNLGSIKAYTYIFPILLYPEEIVDNMKKQLEVKRYIHRHCFERCFLICPYKLNFIDICLNLEGELKYIRGKQEEFVNNLRISLLIRTTLKNSNLLSKDKREQLEKRIKIIIDIICLFYVYNFLVNFRLKKIKIKQVKIDLLKIVILMKKYIDFIIQKYKSTKELFNCVSIYTEIEKSYNEIKNKYKLSKIILDEKCLVCNESTMLNSIISDTCLKKHPIDRSLLTFRQVTHTEIIGKCPSCEGFISKETNELYDLIYLNNVAYSKRICPICYVKYKF